VQVGARPGHHVLACRSDHNIPSSAIWDVQLFLAVLGPHVKSGTRSLGGSPAVGGPTTGNVVVLRPGRRHRPWHESGQPQDRTPPKCDHVIIDRSSAMSGPQARASPGVDSARSAGRVSRGPRPLTSPADARTKVRAQRGARTRLPRHNHQVNRARATSRAVDISHSPRPQREHTSRERPTHHTHPSRQKASPTGIRPAPLGRGRTATNRHTSRTTPLDAMRTRPDDNHTDPGATPTAHHGGHADHRRTPTRRQPPTSGSPATATTRRAHPLTTLPGPGARAAALRPSTDLPAPTAATRQLGGRTMPVRGHESGYPGHHPHRPPSPKPPAATAPHTPPSWDRLRPKLTRTASG